MDHTKHTPLTPAELTPATLEGASIYGADDHKVGKVSHIHGAGTAALVVIDVGGFLGIGAKPVAVGIDQLQFMRDEDGDVHAVTGWTKDQLKDMPEHKD
ncbi:PRC-barrel domain-containing protein [Pelagibacterium montanilacus]|uniref:PRC-barrel domain-containing protein n=1 Tax=Pelagibacterium montanilacus TaxID=2185280 RepID=UPI000F8E73A8|nr:PRC-barrel domain-containing protein [Pelagibacterium montanilacus]